jgi:hypothetical protein
MLPKSLIVDQDTKTVRQRFEDYLKDVAQTDDVDAPAANERAKSGQGPFLT